MYVKRGVLILNEGLRALENPLKSRNFWVHMISAVAADQQMDLLTHRVLITEHSKDFLEAAVIHEFGIIDTALATKEPEKLADIISREWLADLPRDRGLARITFGATSYQCESGRTHRNGIATEAISRSWNEKENYAAERRLPAVARPHC